MRIRTSLFLAAAAVALPHLLGAQESDSLSLSGRSALVFGIGVTGAATSNVAGSGVRAHTSGELAIVTFSHWVNRSVAAQFSASVLGADNQVAAGSVHDNSLTPFLFGLSYSPPPVALSRGFRPYIAAAGGAVVHAVNDVTGGSVTNLVETAPGGRVATGANWFVSRHFLVSVEADYHVAGSFDHPDALTSHANGFGMTFALGFGWGGK
jgi:hypothetical protein